MNRRFVFSFVTAVPLVLAAAHAGAAELTVLGAGPVEGTFKTIAAAFARDTGHKVEGTFSTVGVIEDKIKAGEKPDIVILSAAVMEQMEKSNAIVPGSRIEVARAKSGIAVRAGAPVPDISTPEALRAALLATRSVAYVDPAAGATTGIFFARLLENMHIAGEVNKKATLYKRGYEVAEALAEGKVEIGNTNISELAPNKGVKVVGPLPESIGLVIVYVAGIASSSANADVARAFVAQLTSPAAREQFKAAGL